MIYYFKFCGDVMNGGMSSMMDSGVVDDAREGAEPTN